MDAAGMAVLFLSTVTAVCAQDAALKAPPPRVSTRGQLCSSQFGGNLRRPVPRTTP